jgi:preprotein translocase subunit SecG
MNWATVIVLLVVAVLVIIAVRILQKGRGNDSCCGDNKKNGCAGCSIDCPFRR